MVELILLQSGITLSFYFQFRMWFRSLLVSSRWRLLSFRNDVRNHIMWIKTTYSWTSYGISQSYLLRNGYLFWMVPHCHFDQREKSHPAMKLTFKAINRNENSHTLQVWGILSCSKGFDVGFRMWFLRRTFFEMTAAVIPANLPFGRQEQESKSLLV